MPQLQVKFKNYPALNLDIAETAVGYNYANLIKSNYQQEFPIFRDRPKYTTEYMLELAKQAKEAFGWEWEADTYHIGITALLHKDLEVLLSKGFSAIPAEYDHLIHELHYCLHIIQSGESIKERNGWLQIEWFNDDGFDLIGTDIFQHTMKFGDLRLQNPYVGHGPLQIFLEQDYTNIAQTCKFHDFVKPGINIVINDFGMDCSIDEILTAFKHNSPEFVEKHTEQKIIDYVGYPVIGRVTNLEVLRRVVRASVLDLEEIKFND